jgi:DNA-binding transcriptional MerR regulator
MSCKFLGTTDAALRLGCSTERVRQLERAGKLPAQKLPSGQRLFLSEDVEKLTEERSMRTATKEAATGGDN